MAVTRVPLDQAFELDLRLASAYFASDYSSLAIAEHCSMLKIFTKRP